MRNWAAADVENLFTLQVKQAASKEKETKCYSASQAALEIRSKEHAMVFVANVGKFIGHNGSNINNLTRSLQNHGAEFQRINGDSTNFVVYANDFKSLDIVKEAVLKASFQRKT